MEQGRLVLVTGATGYIGGRLVPRLLEAGYRVRCLVRDARRLQGRPWSEQVEVVEGDATRPETLPAALAGVSAAYFFIHSLSDTANYQERDMAVARSFAQAAKVAAAWRASFTWAAWVIQLRTCPPSALAPGDRRSPRGGRRARDRVPCGDRRRLRQPVVRDDPPPDRAAASHDLPQDGFSPGSSRSPLATC